MNVTSNSSPRKGNLPISGSSRDNPVWITPEEYNRVKIKTYQLEERLTHFQFTLPSTEEEEHFIRELRKEMIAEFPWAFPGVCIAVRPLCDPKDNYFTKHRKPEGP